MINDDVELEILHRGVKVFLDGFLEAMDFIYEQHVAFFKVGEQAGEVGGFLDSRAARAFDARSHGLGNDVGKRGLAETGRAAEQNVVNGFAAFLGGGDSDFEAFLDFGLAGELGKNGRSQRQFERNVGFV